MLTITNEDNMALMARYPDKYFDLAVVDPPYGISQIAFRERQLTKNAKTKQYHNAVYKQSPPDQAYFDELHRVSINQIVWGANYYNDFLPTGKQWIFWDKHTEETNFGDGELAYTSFVGGLKKFSFAWNGMLQGDMKNKETRIHPTQKPVKLYDWIYKNYLPEGGKVLDTHLGSGSSRIAADKAGNIDFTGYELDTEYYEAQEKRWKDYKKQLTIF
jgi:site-specific DNA-methyltransferase (adenine-specific)